LLACWCLAAVPYGHKRTDHYLLPI